jgi:hypothetical protein
MKRNLLLIVTLFFSLALNAQYWSQQNTNMAGTSTGVDQVSLVDSNIVWVNGFNGSGAGQFIQAHARTQDGGATWVAGSYTGFGALVQATVLTAVNYDTAFAIAYDTASSVASFWQTFDGGSTWTMVTGILNGGSTFADGVKFWNSTQGFCYGDPVSNEYDIYTTNDGGGTWNDVDGANIPDPFSASEYGYNGPDCATVLPGGIGFFFTNLGRVYKTVDYGATWTVTPASPFVQTGTYGSNKIYASSENYIICAVYTTAWEWQYTTDGGTTWNAFAPIAGTFYQYGMCYVPGTLNMFVASSPDVNTAYGIGYSFDGGFNWTDYSDATYLQPSGGNVQCLGLAWYNSGLGWVGNYDQGQSYNSILKYDNPAIVNVSNYSFENNDLHIYPNPSNGEVFFAVNGPNKENMSLQVFDVSGSLVYESILNVNSNPVCSYDFSSLSKGIYVAKISGQAENIVHKLVIQ